MATINSGVIEAYKSILADDDLKYVVLKIDDVTNEVVLDDLSDHITNDEIIKKTDSEEGTRDAFTQLTELIKEHRTRSPRFCLFNFGRAGKSKVVLIYWLPVGAVMMSKLLYNGAKPKLSEEFEGAKKTITLKDLGQWDYQTVKKQLL